MSFKNVIECDSCGTEVATERPNQVPAGWYIRMGSPELGPDKFLCSGLCVNHLEYLAEEAKEAEEKRKATERFELDDDPRGVIPPGYFTSL